MSPTCEAGDRGIFNVVEEFGGTVKDLAGDGVLAVFGAPHATEDDPELAVRCGLRILDSIRERRLPVDVNGVGVRCRAGDRVDRVGVVRGGARRGVSAA